MLGSKSAPEVSSVHDGHHQTQVSLGLERVGQRHDEATVNFSQNSLLHDRTLHRDDSESQSVQSSRTETSLEPV